MNENKQESNQENKCKYENMKSYMNAYKITIDYKHKYGMEYQNKYENK